MRSSLWLGSLLVISGCAGSADSSGASGDGAGGGGVSFGGAQDMGEFRSILDRGELPAPNTLDANGFFNEHFSESPPADCGQTLCLTPGLSGNASGYNWYFEISGGGLPVAFAGCGCGPSNAVRAGKIRTVLSTFSLSEPIV